MLQNWWSDLLRRFVEEVTRNFLGKLQMTDYLDANWIFFILLSIQWFLYSSLNQIDWIKMFDTFLYCEFTKIARLFGHHQSALHSLYPKFVALWNVVSVWPKLNYKLDPAVGANIPYLSSIGWSLGNLLVQWCNICLE